MDRIRRLRSFAAFAAVSCLGLAAPAWAGEVDLPRYPSISPDGEHVVFSWRGDLWKAPTSGGTAVRLTSHPAVDSRSGWTPDGRSIVFNSDRSGALNLHVMDADGGNVRQVTHEDTTCLLVDVTADGKITFQASREGDVYRDVRPYWVPLAGGPIRRVHDAFGRAPAFSPDGKKLSFSRHASSWYRRHYRGPDARDVWLQDRDTGAFTRLTHWTGNDGQAKWVGERQLVYLSDQELSTVNLYRLPAVDGKAAPVRITSFEGTDVWDYDVSPDGRTAVLHVWDRLYRLDLRSPGAEPQPIAIEAPDDIGDAIEVKNLGSSVSEAKLSPDGKVMAYVAHGEVYVRNVDDGHPSRRVTDHPAREQFLRWSPDGLRLYFTSDRDGTDSIFAARVDLTRGEILESFEKATKPPEEKKKNEPKAPDKKDDAEKPDDKDAPPKKDDKDGKEAPGAEQAEDPKKPAADAKPAEKKKPEKKDPALDPTRWHDAVRFVIEPVVQATTNDREPWPSPDGKSLAFRRGLGTLVIKDLASGTERVLREGWDRSLDARWSPDSHYIAFHQNDRNFNADVFIARADGSSPPVNISKHPGNDYNPRWSGDGKILSFVSGRKNREFDVYLVFLDKEIEAKPQLELEEYFKERNKAAKGWKPLTPKKPKKDDAKEPGDKSGDAKKAGEKTADGKKDEKPEVPELDLADAYKRLRRVSSLPGNEMNNELTPAGDRVLFTGSNGTDAGLFTVSWDGKGLRKIAPSVSMQQMTGKGDAVVYVQGGRAYKANPAAGGGKPVQLEATMRIDQMAQSSQKFREAARMLGELFYHPDMKGLDWPALTERYHELAARAVTPDEFNMICGRFLGELNASHLGIRASGYRSPTAEPNGRLGIDHEPVEGGFRVTRVIPYGPASKGDMRLREGDVITHVELEPVRPTDSLEARLSGRVGKETILTVRRTPEPVDGKPAAGPLELRLLLTPTSSGAERNLRYEDWQTRRARLVHERSNGRLGYLHIRGMNQSSLDEFERDLFAAAEGREGLLIDVRNNGGGHTADRVLASIMVQPHSYTVPRGADPEMKTGYPQDRLFIQRYVLPINMLCNEKSFSNAEIVSHAFKTLKRGTLVGQQTYGGVISTGGHRLVDGTSVRTPFRGWYLLDDTDMENNGAMPDIVVDQTPEDESAGRDAQLEAAVDDLLKRL